MTEQELAEAKYAAAQLGLIAVVKALVAVVSDSTDPEATRRVLLRIEALALTSLDDAAPFDGFPEPMKTHVKEISTHWVSSLVAATTA